MKYNQRQQLALAQEFIEVLSIERNLGEKTLYAYKNDVDNMISWMELRHQNDLNAEAVMLYFLYLQNEIELSCRSIRRKYVSIRQYCDFLNKTLNMNEVFFKFSSRKFQIPKNLPKTLSKTEIQSLISSVSAEFQTVSSDYHRRLCIRNMCIIELLFCLGLRIGEVAALDIEDYNREDCSILIRGKGKKERMLFISSPVVCQKLNHWLLTRLELEPENSAMFVNKSGGRLSIFSIENIFYKYRDLSKINPHSTPHFLRHSFATQLLNNGANIRDVQELMGHNSIVTTQIYTEVSLNRKKEVLMKYNGRNFINVV
ncbi:tyrosine-type recombinase/integrase [Faecalicatena sp. AGMB00832]|uniref:Tyrosine-type recombinase/integrase n=1 Tax=Faecalicatena faecalis TaxID=2726362 RepID=A0ABS6DAX2_9FIRM|nr:tyrosine-type recombinase/integrase [Faecalicatena faecalis]MBU3878758.1 tyrosine-type recombinase/integrase [Faecalicatena faecalis]